MQAGHGSNDAYTTTGTLADAVELATDYREKDAREIAAHISNMPDANAMLKAFAEEAKTLSDRDLRVVLATHSYTFFAYEYLPHYFTKPFSKVFHSRLFTMLLAVERHLVNTPTVLAGPRDTGKSTCGSFLMPLRCMHCPTYKITPTSLVDMSKRYMVMVSSTRKIASKYVSDIIDELQHNKALHADFGNLYLDSNGKPPVSREWSKVQARTNSGVLLEAEGRQGKLRGLRSRQHRPDLLCADDIEDDKSVKSSKRRQDDWDWFTKTMVNTLSQDTGNALVQGTVLHDNSLIVRLVEYGKAHGWNAHIFRMIEEINGKRVLLWPERYGEAWIAEKISTVSQSAFDQEYQQNPSSGSNDLSYDSFRFYKHSEIFPWLNTKRFRLYLGVDPACKTNEKSDYTAIVPIAFEVETGITYVLPVVRDRLTMQGKVNAIFNVHGLYEHNFVCVGIESVQFQAALKEIIDSESAKRCVTMRTLEIKQTQDKKLRISRMFSAIEHGNIKFLENDTGTQVLIDELIHLYTADFDDTADALEIAVRCKDKQVEYLKNRSGIRVRVT